MNSLLRHAAFIAGLAVLAWVGAGYVATNPLALGITALIAAFYGMGALELRRFRAATTALAQAIDRMPDPLPALGPWLADVPAALRNGVRRRIEGEAVGLPGPTLAPYLAGLLVLLGMLGTFVGMVLTLRGTGLALDGATDLQAVRSSLVAPVKGLGLAFGTSVAGVATSAALGLMSALARRERVQAAQALDARIGTTLRVFSLAHQREESLRLMQRQGELMPALVDTLNALMLTMERQAADSNARLLASQESFQGRTEQAVTGLVSSVDRSLKDSLAESARIAASTLRPVVESTLAAIATETGALHASLAATAQRQVDQLSTRLEGTATGLADTWHSALAHQERSNQGLSQDLHGTLERFAQTFEQRSAALIESLSGRTAQDQLATATALQDMARQTAAAQQAVIAAAATQLDGLSTRLDDTAQRVADTWQQALAQHERASEQAAQQTGQALTTAAGAFEQHSAALLRTVQQSHADLQAEAAAREQQRLAATAQAVEAMAASLRLEWQQAGAQALAQQQAICDTLERTARDVSTQSAAHASGTLAEIARLVQTASAAPQAAADVIAGLQRTHAALQSEAVEREQQRLAAMTQAVEAMAASLREEWQQAGARTLAQQQALCETMERTANEITTSSAAHASSTVAEIERLVQTAAEAPRAAADVIAGLQRTQAELQSDAVERERQRLAAMTQAVEAMAASLREEWQQAGAQTLAQQQAICATLERTAHDITTQSAAHAGATVAEIERLLQAAAQAPRAAAEVIGELRQQLSDSMARDNTLLEERGRMLETLGTLLDGVDQAAHEQRSAIDALVASSAQLFDRVGARFAQQVDAEAGKLAAVAAQVTGSAVEVASLGESFGLAVELFSQSNDKLATQLQRIEGALGKSLARSDEQLEYYVAQAREVVDLSILSQKQIIEDLQRLSGKGAAAPALAAAAA
jgi:hypothetical protein